ncbi:hypothetical protein ACFL6D_01935 [Spirochaetota bacterium]
MEYKIRLDIKFLIIFGALFLNIILLIVLLAQGGYSGSVSEEELKEYANLLRSKELYAETVLEYKKYIQSTGLSEKKRANIYYIIGNIYKNEIYDYKKAMAAYLKVTQLMDRGEVYDEANKSIIECLDRMGRGLEAADALSMTTSLNRKNVSGDDVVLAKIGEHIITEAEIKAYIDSLPESIKSEIDIEKDRKQLILSYIFKNLLYRKAKRLQYENDQDYLRKLEDARKEIMIGELMNKEYFSRMDIKEKELLEYYNSHKREFKDPDTRKQLSFKDAFQSVKIGLTRKKISEKQTELFRELMQEENVQLFFDYE